VILHFPSRRSAQIARRYFNGHDGNGAHSYDSRCRVDGRSAIARAIRRLVEAYSKALGTLASAPTVKARIIELAELETLTAQMRRDALRGCDVDAYDLARLTNSAKRLRESLRLDEPAPAKPLPATLKQALAR
jgi:hypothetical protein